MPYGTKIGRHARYNPHRSVIGEPEVSHSGNLLLRVGRENSDRSESWSQTEHVVMTADEAADFVVDIVATLGLTEDEADGLYDRICQALGYGT